MHIAWHQISRDMAEGGGWPSGPFQQSRPYAVASLALGARLLQAKVSGGGVGMGMGQAVILDRMGLRLCLRGAFSAGPGLATRILRRLARDGARAGRITLALPEQGLSGFGLIPLMTPRHVALWDLRGDEGALMAGMWGKWRNRLRRAMRVGVEAMPGSPRHLPDLVTEEAALRQSRGYRALPAAFTLALPPSDLRLWLWRAKGRVQAAMCFVRHGTWATYHMGHASPLAREAGAHGAMLWQAALALRAEGVTTLDLGDVNTDDAPGLAHFKLGTGAALHPLGRLSWVLPG